MERRRIEILLALILLPLVLLPLLAHWAANDNSKNYANHNYGKNLLNTLEKNSIFMTEGGDNQVFTSAYNQMAEFKRPDVRIYDQKGNVFYRIYGDFRYMSMPEISVKRDIVDFEIFKRGRPVYLTWIRKPDVAICGDWFLKRYGILYKIVPLKYRILQDLGADLEIDLGRALKLFRGYYANPAVLKKIRKNLQDIKRRYASFYARGRIRETQDRSVAHFINNEEKQRIQKAVKDYAVFAGKTLARKVDRVFMMTRLRELEKEGYLKIAGNSIRFIRDIPQPIKGDYWKRYSMSYKKVPNAVHWDYLTREILANYAFNRLQVLRERLNYYSRRQTYYKRKGLALLLKKNSAIIKGLKTEMEVCYRDAARYGHDNGAIHNNLAVIFVKKNDLKRARDAFRRAVAVDPYMFSSTVYYMNLNLRLASAGMDPVKEAAALKEGKELCKKAYTLIKGLGGIPDYRYRPIGGVAQARRQMGAGRSVYVMEQGSRGRASAREIGIDELMSHRRFYARVPGFSVHPDYQRIKRFEVDVLDRRKRIPFSRVVGAKKLVDSNRKDFNTHLAYFQLLVQRKNMFLAIDAFEAMPEKKWDRYDIFYHYGMFLENTGQSQRAIDAYRKFLKKYPDFFVAAFRGALHMERQPKLREQALKLYTRALDADEAVIKKKYPMFSRNIGVFKKAAWTRAYRLAGLLGRSREVVDIYERGNGSWKKSELAVMQSIAYMKALEKLGMYKKAAGMYEQAVKKNPLDFAKLFRLGRLYEERLNDTAKAKGMYRKIDGLRRYMYSHMNAATRTRFFTILGEAVGRYKRLP